MEKNHTLMYGERGTWEFVTGVDEFCKSVVKYKVSRGMYVFYFP